MAHSIWLEMQWNGWRTGTAKVITKIPRRITRGGLTTENIGLYEVARGKMIGQLLESLAVFRNTRPLREARLTFDVFQIHNSRNIIHNLFSDFFLRDQVNGFFQIYREFFC